MQIFLFIIDSIGTYLKQIWFYLTRVRFYGYSSEHCFYSFGTCVFILPFLKNFYKINVVQNVSFTEVREIHKTENKINRRAVK